MGVAEQAYDRWPKAYGGMKIDQAKKLKELEAESSRLKRAGTKTIYITPGSPWESGYCESFNGKLRDELLNGGAVLHAARSSGTDRAMARVLPHRATAQLAWIPPASTRNITAT